MTLVQWDPFRGSRAWEPAVDIVEREDAIVLRAELPGVDRDAIEVRVENNTLILSGERKQTSVEETDTVYRKERVYGAFYRSFRLPKTVDAEKIDAGYKDGVLELKLPKIAAAQPRKIEIQVA